VRVVRAPGDPRDVALGVAIGAFFSLIPVAQMFLAVTAAGVWRRLTGRKVSYVAAAAGTWFTNPLTFGPVYALSTFLGQRVTHALLEAAGVTLGGWGPWAPSATVVETTLGVLVGALLLGPPLALLAYELSYRLVASYQARRIARQRARALRAVGAQDLLGSPRAASNS
jgi:uncharacterized protein (DUF2062 family)